MAVIIVGNLRASTLEGCGIHIIGPSIVYTILASLLQFTEGATESWFGPLATLIGKYLTSFRHPDIGGAVCVGFMERSSLLFAILHGMNSTLICPILTPGIPEYAFLNVAVSLGAGFVEHWLRFWDAATAHELQISIGKQGIFNGALYASGNWLLIWQGAALNMLVYSITAIMSALLWLHIRAAAETVIVRQALEDSELIGAT
eukprot:scaffold30424_cov27-Prasinocladus_malaysianus.AAC.3